MDLSFECPRCERHLFAPRVQIGVTAPCPNCNAAVHRSEDLYVTSPTTSAMTDKIPEKKRYEATVILIEHCAAVPANPKKLKKRTDDFTDPRNWLIRQLRAFRGDQYFAGIFDDKEKRSVFKEKGR